MGIALVSIDALVRWRILMMILENTNNTCPETLMKHTHLDWKAFFVSVSCFRFCNHTDIFTLPTVGLSRQLEHASRSPPSAPERTSTGGLVGKAHTREGTIFNTMSVAGARNED
jgi:hypothetical protein